MNSAFTLFHGRWRGQNCLDSDLPCFAYNCHSSVCSAMLISERGKFPLAWRWPFSTFHRRMCFSVSQFINNRILAKRKLFFLGRIISTKWLLLSFIQDNGQKKTSEVFIWIFKIGKINSPDMLQFHLVPTGKMMPIHLSKELLHWHLLVLVSCWLEGEGDNVQETSIPEGPHFRLWDLDLLIVLPSPVDSFLFAHVSSVLHQIHLCHPLPVLPLLKEATR